MGIAIANRKNHCDFGALRSTRESRSQRQPSDNTESTTTSSETTNRQQQVSSDQATTGSSVTAIDNRQLTDNNQQAARPQQSTAGRQLNNNQSTASSLTTNFQCWTTKVRTERGVSATAMSTDNVDQTIQAMPIKGKTLRPGVTWLVWWERQHGKTGIETTTGVSSWTSEFNTTADI